MSSLMLTNFYIEKGQKKALEAKAKSNGTKVSEELRQAIDIYMTGLSVEELELLKATAQRAEEDLTAMADLLEQANKRMEATLNEIKKLRAGGLR